MPLNSAANPDPARRFGARQRAEEGPLRGSDPVGAQAADAILPDACR